MKTPLPIPRAATALTLGKENKDFVDAAPVLRMMARGVAGGPKTLFRFYPRRIIPGTSKGVLLDPIAAIPRKRGICGGAQKPPHQRKGREAVKGYQSEDYIDGGEQPGSNSLSVVVRWFWRNCGGGPDQERWHGLLIIWLEIFVSSRRTRGNGWSQGRSWGELPEQRDLISIKPEKFISMSSSL